MIDPHTQLETFKAGVDHLGSVEAAARWMEINVRSLRYVLNGRRTLHDGHCRALAAALVAHAAVSRELERRISPAFRANLTPEQATQKPHGNRFDRRSNPARPEPVEGFDQRAPVEGPSSDTGMKRLCRFHAADQATRRAMASAETVPSIRSAMEADLGNRSDQPEDRTNG